MRAATKTTMKT